MLLIENMNGVNSILVYALMNVNIFFLGICDKMLSNLILFKDIIKNKIGGSTCAYGNPVDYWPPEKFIGIKS